MKNSQGNTVKQRQLYTVVFKSSGKVANKFSSLAQAKYWITENDTLFTGENGNEPMKNAGLFEVRKMKVE